MDAITPDHRVARNGQRHHPRYEGRVRCGLVVGEEVWSGWIRDLAVGGAGLEPAMPATLGRRVLLTCPAFDFDAPLTGRVINVAHRRTCIEFDLAPEIEAQLMEFLVKHSESN